MVEADDRANDGEAETAAAILIVMRRKPGKSLKGVIELSVGQPRAFVLDNNGPGIDAEPGKEGYRAAWR